MLSNLTKTALEKRALGILNRAMLGAGLGGTAGAFTAPEGSMQEGAMRGAMAGAGVAAAKKMLPWGLGHLPLGTAAGGIAGATTPEKSFPQKLYNQI